MIRFAAFCLGAGAALLSGCNARIASSNDSDWQRNALDAKEVVREQAVVLPAYPRAEDLVEFAAGPSGSHRFFVDGRTLEVGADGVVRYALVVQTAGGARNTSFEGIRCKTVEKRIYALGHPQGKWIEAKRAGWEEIDAARANEYQAVLYRDYFCPDRMVVESREAALRALQRGRFHGGRAPYE